MYTRPNGMSAAIEPSDEVAWVSRASCAKTKPTAIQPQTASERSLPERRPSRRCSRSLMTAAAASTSSAIWITVHQVRRRSLIGSGSSAPTAVGDLVPEVVDVDAGRFHRVPERGPERRRLQVGEQRRRHRRCRATRRPRATARSVPRQCRRGDEELDAVGLELVLCSGDDRGSREVDERRLRRRRPRRWTGRSGGGRCWPRGGARARASCRAESPVVERRPRQRPRARRRARGTRAARRRTASRRP